MPFFVALTLTPPSSKKNRVAFKPALAEDAFVLNLNLVLLRAMGVPRVQQ
jgi:hypothetical protein